MKGKIKNQNLCFWFVLDGSFPAKRGKQELTSSLSNYICFAEFLRRKVL